MAEYQKQRAITPNVCEFASWLPERPEHSNKGTFGRVLVVAGSPGMSGAAYFSALAAYRTGAGLVEILTAEENRTVLQTQLPEAIVTCYRASAPDRKVLLAAAARADVAVIGPGLGTTDTARFVLAEMASVLKVPTVLDADALNLIAGHRDLRSLFACPIIITPHMMEAARLSGIPMPELAENPEQHARGLAVSYRATCILKDSVTYIAGTDGSMYRNPTGNNGMATGGSGDVLTGVIAGLLAEDHETGRLSLSCAAALAVYLHGSAGDIATERLGQNAVMASDLANSIGLAIRKLAEAAQ